MAGSMPAVVPLVAGLCPTPSTSAASLPGPGSKADGSGGGADVVARVTLEVFAFEIIRAMELTTILNLCHHHRGFVYYHARFGSDLGGRRRCGGAGYSGSLRLRNHSRHGTDHDSKPLPPPSGIRLLSRPLRL